MIPTGLGCVRDHARFPHIRGDAPQRLDTQQRAFAVPPHKWVVGRTLEWEFALPMPVNSAYQSKPSEATYPESATPKPAPQSKTDNPSGAKAKATQEAKRQAARSTTGRETRPPSAGSTAASWRRNAGGKPRSLASAGAAPNRPSRARPAAPPAPRSAGSTAGAGTPSEENRPLRTKIRTCLVTTASLGNQSSRHRWRPSSWCRVSAA